MTQHWLFETRTWRLGVLAIGLFLSQLVGLYGQQDQRAFESFQTTNSAGSVELMAGSSQNLRFVYAIPEAYVENPDVLRVSAVAPNELCVTGLKPGFSTLTVLNADQEREVISVNVTPDARKLELALKHHFKNASIRVDALQTGVILSGTVARASDIDDALLVAREFFPTNVINRLEVAGSQIVAIEVQVYEVSRTKLRNLGIDWSVLGSSVDVVSGFADLINTFSSQPASQQNLRFGVINSSNDFNLFINALEKKNIAKLMAQPTLVAQHGRPAEFLSGGEYPVPVQAGLGTTSIEFKPFGTKLDFVPMIMGEGFLTLEVRAEVSEIARDIATETGIPGLRVRRVNTAVPMRSGQTLALAGDYNEKSEGENKGAPWLSNQSGWGAFFRNTRNQKTETELVFLITPRFINPIEQAALNHTLPGRNTRDPSTYELMINGYLEVPDCGDDCPVNRFGVDVMPTAPSHSMGYQFSDQRPSTTNRNSPPAAGISRPASFGNSPQPTRSGFGYPSTRNPPYDVPANNNARGWNPNRQ